MKRKEARNSDITGDEVDCILHEFCAPFVGFSLSGTIALVFGLIYLAQSISRRKSWEITTGTIVGVHGCGKSEENGPNTGSETWSAVVEYEVEGNVFEMTNKHCFGKPPTIGKIFPVLYNPKSPFESDSASFFALWFLPTILFSLATMLLLRALIIAKRMRFKFTR